MKQTKRQSKSEMIKQHAKLHNKYKEYSLKTIQELEELLPNLRSGYKEVCISVMKDKFIMDLRSKQTNEIEGEA